MTIFKLKNMGLKYNYLTVDGWGLNNEKFKNELLQTKYLKNKQNFLNNYSDIVIF